MSEQPRKRARLEFQKTTNSSILTLPDDCIVHAFSFLHPIHDICKSVIQTCKKWYNMLNTLEHNLFRHIDFTGYDNLPLMLQKPSKPTSATMLALLRMIKQTSCLETFILHSTDMFEFVPISTECLEYIFTHDLFKNLKHLALDQSKDAISTALAKVLKTCTALKKLVLPHYNVQVMAAVVSSCTELEYLNINSEDTYVNDDQGILTSSWNLGKLKDLDGLQDWIMTPSVLKKSPLLERFHWEGYSVPNYVPIISQHYPNVKGIICGSRYLKELEIFSSVASFLPNVTEISITDGFIYDEELQQVGTQCKKLEKFSYLDEYEADTYPMSDFLRDIGPQLKELDVRLDCANLEEYSGIIKSCCPNLRKLAFQDDNNPKWFEGGLLQFIKEMPDLEEITLLVENHCDMYEALKDFEKERQSRKKILEITMNEIFGIPDFKVERELDDVYTTIRLSEHGLTLSFKFTCADWETPIYHIKIKRMNNAHVQ
jgi:DNA-directed RNA polymerase subunit L